MKKKNEIKISYSYPFAFWFNPIIQSSLCSCSKEQLDKIVKQDNRNLDLLDYKDLAILNQAMYYNENKAYNDEGIINKDGTTNIFIN